jgi:hypothetical protein
MTTRPPINALSSLLCGISFIVFACTASPAVATSLLSDSTVRSAPPCLDPFEYPSCFDLTPCTCAASDTTITYAVPPGGDTCYGYKCLQQGDMSKGGIMTPACAVDGAKNGSSMRVTDSVDMSKCTGKAAGSSVSTTTPLPTLGDRLIPTSLPAP